MDIQLVTIDPQTNKVILGIKAKTVSDEEELTQVVVFSLLNITGKDALDPGRGGGLPAILGVSNINLDDPQELFGEIARLVAKSQTEIIADQVGLSLNPRGRLRELTIMEIIEGDSIDAVFVRIRIINEAGRQIDVVL